MQKPNRTTTGTKEDEDRGSEQNSLSEVCPPVDICTVYNITDVGLDPDAAAGDAAGISQIFPLRVCAEDAALGAPTGEREGLQTAGVSQSGLLLTACCM